MPKSKNSKSRSKNKSRNVSKSKSRKRLGGSKAKCIDLVMGTENEISTYLTEDANNIIFTQTNGKIFCNNRENLKQHYLNNIVFPCTQVFSGDQVVLFVTENRHVSSNKPIITKIPYIKLKPLAIGYSGVVTLESFMNLVINSSIKEFSLIDTNERLVATIDRNLVSGYLQADVSPTAVSNAHCQEGTGIKIFKIATKEQPNYEDWQKENFGIPFSDADYRLANHLRNSSGPAGHNIEHTLAHANPLPPLTYADFSSPVSQDDNSEQNIEEENEQPWSLYPYLNHLNNNQVVDTAPVEWQDSQISDELNNLANSIVTPGSPEVIDRRNRNMGNTNVRRSLLSQLDDDRATGSLFSQIPAAQRPPSQSSSDSSDDEPASPILGAIRPRSNSNEDRRNMRYRTMGHGGKKRNTRNKIKKNKKSNKTRKIR